MERHLSLLVLVAALLAAPTGRTQGQPSDVTDMQALQAAVRADKRSYVASTLPLTDDEAQRFWPLYDAYQRQLELANRRRSVALVSVVGLGPTIGDLHARNVVKELVAADDLELRARRTLRDRVMKALPARKAIRYLQLESKIRAAQDYDLATTIPLLKQ